MLSLDATTFPLFTIWHLRNVDKDAALWTLSVNYKVPVEDSALAAILQAEMNLPLMAPDDPGLADRIQLLVPEVRALTEGADQLAEGPFILPLTRRLTRLMRKPQQRGRERALLCIGDQVDNAGTVRRDFSIDLPLEQLSPASQAAIHRIDALALQLSYRAFAERAAGLSKEPFQFAVPHARKVRAFVAYRRTHLAEAQRLHSTLQQMGAGTMFLPIIDAHDMRIGDWKQQIFDWIDTAEVFVALVSADYAEPGTVGFEEFQRAQEAAHRKGWADFFAPVFTCPQAACSAAGQQLWKYDGYIANDESAVTPGNPELKKWLGRVALAGVRHFEVRRPNSPSRS